jgi:redox-sensitive bicupin YhaK (pirin superfamily)
LIKKLAYSKQVKGNFNNGEIIENKPIGFPQEGGLKKYSNIFYWANAIGITNSAIELHPHRGFEIMSIVLEGNIKHYDTLLKKWISLKKGDVQLIKSGSGISHAEFLEKGSRIFQIWFYPDLRKTLLQKPTYKDYNKNILPIKEGVTTIIGKDSPIKLESERVEVFEIEFAKKSFEIECDKDYYYSLYLIKGTIKIQQVDMQKDDFIIVESEKSLHIEVSDGGCLLYIKSPIFTSYPTY